MSDKKERAEDRLPRDILARASVRGNEYAWPIDDIPLVIEAARQAGLVNSGGQLQFRLPERTCDCYWIEVDTSNSVPETLPYEDRVEKSATVALQELNRLKESFDFVAEGRSAFGDVLERIESQGGELSEIMCFAWYLGDE